MNKAILYKNLKIGESSFVEKVCDLIEYLFSMAEYMYLLHLFILVALP